MTASVKQDLLVGIIHIIMNRVNSAAGAAVSADRAPRRGRSLSGSVIDGVSATTATTLEGVVKIHPVTDLIRQQSDTRSRYLI